MSAPNDIAGFEQVLTSPWLGVASCVAALQALLVGIANMKRYRVAPALAEIAASTRAVRVAVCIPARNERENIEACVRSVLSSREVDVRAYVYDDESTDGTGEIVARLATEDARVVVVPRRALPAGWNGKQHACFRMAEHGLAYDPELEWFLFTDADVRLEPDAVARALGFAQRADAALVSTVPREITGSIGEMLLVPLIHFVLMGYLPFGRMRTTRDPAASAACGQFILVSRAAYRASGGHEGFRDSMHDGVKFPRAVRRAGLRTDLYDGTESVSCRMYRGFVQTWRGFAKNAYEGLGNLGLLVFITIWHVVGHIVPWVVIVAATLSVDARSESFSARMLAVAAILCGLAYRALLCVRFRQSWLNVPLHPMSIATLTAVQWWSLWLDRTGRRGWKGRVAGAKPPAR
ncbi:MAG: glycosyltransferase family 2 protein [Limnohabitans sp.]|jgi:glycosyltransferase involved in cell wall biosynthesis|nr:glycosyltransferase family 2 protein [Limnohabitans sp.]